MSMKISDSIRKEQPENGKAEGERLRPCRDEQRWEAGVRGDHEVSTEFFEENQGCFFGCEKFRENAVLGAVLPLFLFCLQKEKIPKGL